MKLNIFLGYEYIDAKTIDYEIKPSVYELTDLNAVFLKYLEVKADEKFMKSILTTKYDLIFDFHLIEVLGFTNKRYNAGTQLSEKVININSVDKVHLKCS